MVTGTLKSCLIIVAKWLDSYKFGVKAVVAARSLFLRYRSRVS